MKIEALHLMKEGKLFDVDMIDDDFFEVKTNPAIAELVGSNDPKKFESYLRKSFRHFYNLDKKLKVNKRKGRLSINKL